MTDTPKEEIRLAIERMAADNHQPRRDGRGQRWPMRMVTSAALLRTIEAHERHFGQRAHDDNMFATVEQTLGFSSAMSDVIPALLRTSKVWSFRHQRFLLPSEHCKVMGIPLNASVESLSPAKMKAVAGNAMHAGALASVVLFTLSNIAWV
jgi:hypothetical protein